MNTKEVGVEAIVKTRLLANRKLMAITKEAAVKEIERKYGLVGDVIEIVKSCHYTCQLIEAFEHKHVFYTGMVANDDN